MGKCWIYNELADIPDEFIVIDKLEHSDFEVSSLSSLDLSGKSELDFSSDSFDSFDLTQPFLDNTLSK